MGERIQRKRTKGWRMPEGAIYVGRPSRWGNPWKIGDPDPAWCGQSVTFSPLGLCAGVLDARGAQWHFRLGAIDLLMREPDWLGPLRGKDLACWCPEACGAAVDRGWGPFGGPYDPCVKPRGHDGGHDPCAPPYCHADVLLELANR